MSHIQLFTAWIYFTNFTKDRWPFKVLAAACVIMSLGDTAGTGKYLALQHRLRYSVLCFSCVDLRLGRCWLWRYGSSFIVLDPGSDWIQIVEPSVLSFNHW